MNRAFLIDTDMGSDDAVALIMALRSPVVDVVAITTVAGNVSQRQATGNALIVTDLCQISVPVYAGATRPLVRPHIDAEFFHGQDGLGEQNYSPSKRQPETKHAVQAIIDTAHEHPGLVVVTLGPLTNVALAIRQAPDIVPRIARCVVMGGAACTVGNVTPAAEYNIWCDPEAARIVFLSGLPVEMVGWEFCVGEHALNEKEMAHIRAFDTPFAHFTLDSNRIAMQAYHEQTGLHGLSLPDPVAMAIAIDRSIVTAASQHYVAVETQSTLTRGMTVVDKLNVAHDARNQHIWQEAIDKAARINVTWAIDIPRWKQLLYSLLR